MTNEELKKLRDGDIVRNRGTGYGYIVQHVIAGVPIVSRTIEIHNASEWDKVQEDPGECEMFRGLHAAGWDYMPYNTWRTPNGGVFTGSTRQAWAAMKNKNIPSPGIVEMTTELVKLGWTFDEGVNHWLSPDRLYIAVLIRTAWKSRHAHGKPALDDCERLRELHAAGWDYALNDLWRTSSRGYFTGTIQQAWLKMKWG